MGVYVTTDQLRAEPEVPVGDPPSDADLEAIIARAEDQIDAWLPGLPIDEATGRAIVETNVAAWQWARLQRATVRLAAHLYADPDILEPTRYDEISGPDFSKKGPRPATGRIPDVTGPLTASALRLTGARATA
jgi:hypothetical protein